MEAFVEEAATWIALAVEASAVMIIAFGAVEALTAIVVNVSRAPRGTAIHRKVIWVRFGVWLLLGLEFELAADIIRSTISPSWTDVGQLGAIAVIRTVLNYFLEKDLEKYAGGAAEA